MDRDLPNPAPIPPPAENPQADSADILIGRLAGGLLHEISNPVASLSANVETRQQVIEALRAAVAGDGRLTPKATKLLEVLASLQQVDQLACDRITGLLRAWRSHARLAADDFGPVAIPGILLDSIRLVNAEYRRRIEIETRFDAVPDVWGVAAPLGRAFLNLLVNAAQAIDGEGRIMVEARDRGATVEIRISDTGSGMTPEVQARIFTRGFTTKPVGIGTGLGLFLSRRIIEDQHRGTIRFESSPGRGTTFFVQLPAARAPQEES